MIKLGHLMILTLVHNVCHCSIIVHVTSSCDMDFSDFKGVKLIFLDERMKNWL